MIDRYAFYGQAAKLHDFYDGAWSENIKLHKKETIDKLIEIAVAKGYHPDIASKDITGWIKLADPACADYDERYRTVATTKKSKDWAFVESLTLPGLMVSIIEEAKVSKKKNLPYGQMSRWKGQFIYPTSEWYHPLFAKDLYKLKPEWCEYLLSEDEQTELLLAMLGAGHIPTGLDPWIVPKDHPLAKFKGTLKPYPAKVMLKQGKEKTVVAAFVEKNLKKGVKPEKEWKWLLYRAPEIADKLAQKYPKITNQQQWLKGNLTPAQQEKVDKWNRVAELLLTDVDDYELVKTMSKDDRALVGNHLKMLDQSFAFMSDKVRNTIEPIIEKIKEQRPLLYQLYCHTEQTTTANVVGEWLRDIENQQKQKEFIEKAKAGIEFNKMSKDERYSLTSFVRKGTKYLEFKKEIESLRPDWFDKKLLAKDRSDRFHRRGKYKELTE